MKCRCGVELTGTLGILCNHSYSIVYDKEQEKWVKEVGSVTYVCGCCLELLNLHDIEDILRQVDEL